MPTYVYECTYGHTFEVQQRITEKPLKQCPKTSGSDPGGFGLDPDHVCGSPCKRIIQPANFSLKGGGWYKDGYSSAPAKKSGGGKKKDS